MSASQSVARRGAAGWGPVKAMWPVIGRPAAAAVVAAIRRAGTVAPGAGGQIWLSRPRPGVQLLAMGSPFGGAVRSASSHRAGGNVGPFSALLRKLDRARGPGQVAFIVDQLVGTGVLGNPKRMKTLLMAMGRNRLTNEAVELHSRMAAPDAYTYTALVKVCDNAGDLGQALLVFAEMKAAGVPPDAVTFNSLISACANAGDLRKGTRFFQEMQDGGIQPTDVTCSSPMELFDSCGRPDAIAKAFARAADQCCFKAAVTSRKHGARNTIDLHECSKLVALAAVRCKLDSPTDWDLEVGLCIITGQGHQRRRPGGASGREGPTQKRSVCRA